MLICLWYLPDLALIFCKLTPNAVWNNPLNAGSVLSTLYQIPWNTEAYTRHIAFVVLLAALEYLLCREDASMAQSRAALGQLWDSTGSCCSGCPLRRGQHARTVSHWLLATREKRRLFASLQNGAERSSSTLQTSHLQQHMIMRKSKLFRLWDFWMTRSVLNSTNYQLEA